MDAGPAALSLLVCSLFTITELATSKYPRTGSLLLKDWAFWTFAFIYGIIALLISLGLGALIESKSVVIEGLGLSDPWVLAASVGVGIKGFLHIRLISIGSFPVGTETLVQIFEPWFLRTIELNHYNALMGSLSPIATRYHDLINVRQRIKDNIPRSFKPEEIAAIITDVDKSTSVTEALQIYVNQVGFRTLKRVFPL